MQEVFPCHDIIIRISFLAMPLSQRRKSSLKPPSRKGSEQLKEKPLEEPVPEEPKPEDKPDGKEPEKKDAAPEEKKPTTGEPPKFIEVYKDTVSKVRDIFDVASSVCYGVWMESASHQLGKYKGLYRLHEICAVILNGYLVNDRPYTSLKTRETQITHFKLFVQHCACWWPSTVRW